jgi:F0F1-type ATP synthase membrane subunit b/b'
MNEPTNMPAGGPGTSPGQTHDRAPDAGDAARQAREGTARVGDDFRQTADRVKDTATATAQEVADRVKEQAKQTGDKIKEQSRGFLNEQKSRVGAEIQTYSAAARQAAERLEGESDANLAQYVSTAADRLDRLGSRIQERDVGQLVDDVEEIARRRPEVFFGGLFVAGLAVARFLKASKQRRQRDRYNQGSQLAVRYQGVAGSTMVTPGAWPAGQTGAETGGTI